MSSASHWQRTATILPLSTDFPPPADVIVIGDGLMGWLPHVPSLLKWLSCRRKHHAQ